MGGQGDFEGWKGSATWTWEKGGNVSRPVCHSFTRGAKYWWLKASSLGDSGEARGNFNKKGKKKRYVKKGGAPIILQNKGCGRRNVILKKRNRARYVDIAGFVIPNEK